MASGACKSADRGGRRADDHGFGLVINAADIAAIWRAAGLLASRPARCRMPGKAS